VHLLMSSFLRKITRRSRKRNHHNQEKNRQDESRPVTHLSDEDLSDMEALLRRNRPPSPPELSAPQQPGCPDDDVIENFLSRRMKRKEKRLFMEHLSRCDACRTLLAEAVRQPAELARQDEGRLLTRLPSIDPFVPGTNETARVTTPDHSRPRPRSPWGWGFGVATPAAAAVCIGIILFLGRPNIDMVVHLNRGHVVRSTSAVPLNPGEELQQGDRFRAEIVARKDGFVYFYLLTEFHSGEFLFPSPSIPQENRVRKGEHLFVPGQGLWIVDDKSGGEETLYLLFSETPAPSDEISRILGELEDSKKTRSAVEKILSRYFSIEEKITYRHK